jgi:hypothetical protein
VGEGKQPAGAPEQPGLHERLRKLSSRTKRLVRRVVLACALIGLVFGLLPGGLLLFATYPGLFLSLPTQRLLAVAATGACAGVGYLFGQEVLFVVFKGNYQQAWNELTKTSFSQALVSEEHWDRVFAPLRESPFTRWHLPTKPRSIEGRIKLAAAFHRALTEVAAGREPSRKSLLVGVASWYMVDFVSCSVPPVMAFTCYSCTLMSPIAIFFFSILGVGSFMSRRWETAGYVAAICDFITETPEEQWLKG